MEPRMLFRTVFLFAAVLIAAFPAAAQDAAGARGAAADYRIGANDLLSIAVYDFPDLSRDVRVAEDGIITLPLVPQPLQAAGRTRKELEQAIAAALQARGIVNAPQV